MEVRRGDRPDAPVGLRGKRLLLVLRRRRDHHVFAVDVRRLRRHRRQLRLLPRLLLDLRDLLPLQRRRRDLHPQDHVPDLRLRQRRHVHVVLLPVVREDQILQRHLHANPLLVRQVRPDVMRLRHHRLVRPQNHLRTVLRDVERAQNQDQTRKRRVRRNRLQPVVVDVEQHHLRLRRLEDQITELLHLQARLERQLQLRALDHDIRKIQAVDFEWIKHALASDDDLLRLFLDRQRPNQRRDFLRGLPLGQLAQPLLTRPDRRVDDLQEELARPRIENEDAPVNGLRRQVTFEGFVDGDPIDVRVVDEPDDLVRKELAVVLGR
mmetsp:Transcript_24497/g.79136  ORF Transcript_24497/g.79136 Transcript_24497/m.79136 type:complete len:322 (-) Transcript_24497:5563-6528(-)